MGSINSAFGIISGALDADQAALSVVANNVANANTAGYTAERPEWRQNGTIQVSGRLLGDGVTSAGYTSQRDRVLEERLAQQKQLASASSARLSALNNIESVFPVTSETSSTGDIGAGITSFFNSFASLEASPTNSALRQQVLSSASTLAGAISGAARSLNSQRSALDQAAAGVASQVNALTSTIAGLNQRIQAESPTADAGPLEDQRQQALSQLSELVGINQITTENNGLTVTTTSGQVLVAGNQNVALSGGNVGGVTHFFLNGSDVTSGLTSGGGQLGGYLTARDGDVPTALGALDQLAYSLSTAVNAQNNAGTDLNGATGTAADPLNIFREPTAMAGAAMSMTVVMSDPNRIAAASPGSGTGNNSNATAMAGMMTGSVVNGQTPINYFSNFVSSLGAAVSEVKAENTAQTASVTQLQSQRDALSGVNLNDEASALSTLETSYQAASQVFNILNRIISSALNLGQQTTV